MRSFLEKNELLEIVSMLVGLTNSLNARIQEDASGYPGSEQEQEQEQEQE